MTTILKASPRQFVNTPSVERIALRALRYLQSGFSIHLRGPAGTGKTTLALHLADLISRPIMLMFGDDEFKSSDLIGNQTGYTRKKVVDNYIHNVVKVEDELRHNWIDSRLTFACREGFTLVYDEFNRSRPEVNNILLSVLEEKLLVLPPSNNRSEYLRVNPHFRAILTSNPEEYSGVHSTQDALLDRLITINIPEPDELTQQEIAIHRAGIDRESALTIVRLVKAFRSRTQNEKSSGLRASLMIAKICHQHEIAVMSENAEFREICQDILLSRTTLPLEDATRMLWELFNESIAASPSRFATNRAIDRSTNNLELDDLASDNLGSDNLESDESLSSPASSSAESDRPITNTSRNPKTNTNHKEKTTPKPQIDTKETVEESEQSIASEAEFAVIPSEELPYEKQIYSYLQQNRNAKLTDIANALGIKRSQAVKALQALTDKGLLILQNPAEPSSLYTLSHDEGEV